MAPFGVVLVNSARRAINQLLGINQLCSTTSFFKKPSYITRRNPGRHSPFQLDHFFVKQKDFERVRNAEIWACGIDSDHRGST
jgi:hypothetical protein